MIIQYTERKIIVDLDKVAKAAAQITVDAICLAIIIKAYTNLVSTSKILYERDCKLPSDGFFCFINYSRMESANLLNSCVDKVGGIFAFATLAYISRNTISMGRRKISQYRIDKQKQLEPKGISY